MPQITIEALTEICENKGKLYAIKSIRLNNPEMTLLQAKEYIDSVTAKVPRPRKLIAIIHCLSNNESTLTPIQAIQAIFNVYKDYSITNMAQFRSLLEEMK